MEPQLTFKQIINNFELTAKIYTVKSGVVDWKLTDIKEIGQRTSYSEKAIRMIISTFRKSMYNHLKEVGILTSNN